MTDIILDCDCTMGLPHKEVDDGLLLLYLLGRADLNLLGVTTTFGNGTIDDVLQSTHWLLNAIGHADVPVYRGEGAPGEHDTPAADYLAQMVTERPGEITLLASGPLGNLHAAARRDPAFWRNVGPVICMGGYLHPLRLGSRDLPELNFSANPEASHVVLHAARPLAVMNAHLCLQVAFTPADRDRIQHWPEALRRSVLDWQQAFGDKCGLSELYLWDLLTALYLTHPDAFEANPVHFASTADDLADGALILAADGQGEPVNMPSRLHDVEGLKEALFAAWDAVLGLNS